MDSPGQHQNDQLMQTSQIFTKIIKSQQLENSYHKLLQVAQDVIKRKKWSENNYEIAMVRYFKENTHFTNQEIQSSMFTPGYQYINNDTDL